MQSKCKQCSLFAIGAVLFIPLAFCLQIFWSSQALAEPDAPKGYEEAEKEPEQQEMQESLSQLQARAQELQQEIASIREKALDNNPELEDLLRDLVLIRNEVMQENLKQEDMDQEELQALEEKLKHPESSSNSRADLEERKKQMFEKYKKAELRTARNDKVQEAREKFYSKLLEASKKQDQDIQQKLQQLQKLQHQLRYVKEEAQPENQR